MTREELLERRTALFAMLTQGVTVIAWGDRRLEYNSPGEITSAIAAVDKALAELDGTTRTRQFTTIAGFCPRR